MVVFDDSRRRNDGSLDCLENETLLDLSALVELLDGIKHAKYQLRLMTAEGKTLQPLYKSYEKMLFDYRVELKKRLHYVGNGALELIGRYNAIQIPDKE